MIIYFILFIIIFTLILTNQVMKVLHKSAHFNTLLLVHTDLN